MNNIDTSLELMQKLCDATPFSIQFWDDSLKIVDCNQATVSLFGVADKQDYVDRYEEFMPEYQPDGRLSKDAIKDHIKKAFDEGYFRMDWMQRALDGEPLPTETTLVRVEYGESYLVAAYVEDLREYEQMLQDVNDASAQLKAVVSNYPGAICSADKDFNITLFDGLLVPHLVDKALFFEGQDLKVALQKPEFRVVMEHLALTYTEGAQDWTFEANGKALHMVTTPLFDDNGDTTGLVAKLEDITELNSIQKELKEALAKAEEAVRVSEAAKVTTEAMFNANPQMNVMFDKNFKLVDCNPSAMKFFRFNTKEELLEGFIERVVNSIPAVQSDGRVSTSLPERLTTAAKDGQVKFKTEIFLDGERKNLDVEFKSIAYEGEHAIVGYVYDMTESREREKELERAHELNEAQLEELNKALKQTEAAIEALEEAKSTTSAMFETNPQINILFSDKLQVLDCNPGALKFTGFADKETFAVGFPAFMQNNLPEFQSDGRPSMSLAERLMIAVKQGHDKFDTEIYIGGEMRNINVELQRIPYKGSFGIVAYVNDLTEIRVREMELERVHDLNKLQLTKLDLVVKASKIGLWDMTVDYDDKGKKTETVAWSDEFRQMLGYEDVNDFPNVPESWSDNLHPDDRETALEAFGLFMKDKTGKTPYDVEYRMRTKGGKYAYFHDSCEAIRDEEGKAIHIAGALVDITDTKNILLDTERQKIEAEAANQAKSSFLSTMSHEIRTPMNAILGITEIQLQDERLDNSIKEAFERIYASGDLLLGIINDILDLSKIETGKLELDDDKYEVASMISDTAQLNMMRIGSKSIDFILSIDESMPSTLRGDELRIKQILNNLLSNAIKYTAAGEVRLSVSSEEIKDDDEKVMLIIDVVDTGQGMTKDQISKLFDEYSRFNMETNRTTEGTGLGMSITQNLIRLMDGEILINSKPGKGSTFTVRIPQTRIGDQLLGEEMAENLCQFRTRSRAQMKRVQISREPMPYGNVLIVDDVETNIYVARGLLVPYELNIDAADSGFTAIDKIKSGKEYDIIFMDHMMPKMDGVEATKIIRDLGYERPIVALTANAVAGQADIFLANGFDDYISKPIDIRQLNNVLNKLIRDQQPQAVIDAVRNRVKAKTDKASLKRRKTDIDAHFAEVFVRDALKSLAELETIVAKNDYSDESNLRSYIIHVHGMKSALANVGKMDLSAVALKLETAGREEKFEILANETDAFISSLKAFVDELAPKQEKKADADIVEDEAYLKESLLAIKAACEDYDESAADGALRELREGEWSEKTAALLGSIAEKLLHSDFDEIVTEIDEFFG